jgi:uncharacterized membrane protein
MKTRAVTLVALFIAIGVLLPIAFHALGMGKMFLPMHIPVLLAGFIAGPVAGLIVGGITPMLSAVLTGMPALSPPVAQAMVFELAIYGCVVGFARKTLKMGVHISLVGGLLVGRIIYGAIGYLLLPVFGLGQVPLWAPITSSIATSLPGVLIQIVILPPLAKHIDKLTRNS